MIENENKDSSGKGIPCSNKLIVSKEDTLEQRTPEKFLTGFTLSQPPTSSNSELLLVIESFFKNYENKLTRREYRYALGGLFRYLGDEVIHPRDLKKRHLIDYKDFCHERGLSSKTILKKLSGISAFCRYLAQEGYLERDITYGITRPSSENRIETADIKDKDVVRIFEALDPKSHYYACHKGILAVGFYAGLRAKEIANLRLKNLGSVDGVKVIRFKIKGGRTHEIAMHPTIQAAVEQQIRRLAGLGFDTENPEQLLFTSFKTKQNLPFSANAITRIVKSCLEKAGIDKSDFRRYSTHSMRATFASHLLNEKSLPLEKVQKLLGHMNPATTQKYNKRSETHDRSGVFQVFYS